MTAAAVISPSAADTLAGHGPVCVLAARRASTVCQASVRRTNWPRMGRPSKMNLCSSDIRTKWRSTGVFQARCANRLLAQRYQRGGRPGGMGAAPRADIQTATTGETGVDIQFFGPAALQDVVEYLYVHARSEEHTSELQARGQLVCCR